MSRLRLASLFAIFTFSVAGFSQDALFLSPKQFQGIKSSCEFHLSTTGVNGPALTSWQNFPVRWIFVKTGEVQENRDTADEWLTDGGRLIAPIQGKGPAMVGIDFQPFIETVNTKSLDTFLEYPSDKTAPATSRIRHFRSAITLLSTSGAKMNEPHSSIATTETSLTSSIHPLMDPTSFRLGSDMAFELVVRGSEAEEATVHIINLNSKRTWTVETKEGGMALFRPDTSGIYEVKFQYCRPVKGDHEADFEFYSTTLTFEVPQQKEVKK